MSTLPTNWKTESDMINTNPISMPITASAPPTALHRIAQIRKQQGISVRSAARRMGVNAETVRREEKEDCNLSLADLYRWQKALEVPITDLLVEQEGPLSTPVMMRAQMLRVMKTVQAIREKSYKNVSLERLSDMLYGQLTDIMPELSDVTAWHTVGQRRTQTEYGRTATNTIPDSWFGE